VELGKTKQCLTYLSSYSILSPMAKNITRSDDWKLDHSNQLPVILNTLQIYRDFVQCLVGIVYANWADIGKISNSNYRQTFVEKLIHSTKNNKAKYSIFDKRFYKFPSYFRRAAISAAIGVVSSFVSRYNKWQGGIRRWKDEKPPKLTAKTNLFPSLYSYNCILYYEESVEIKVFKDNDWKWISLPILKKGKRHLKHKALAPFLIVRGQKVFLSVPFNIIVTKENAPDLQKDPVACFDLGINHGAVGSILHSNGTVTARQFIDRAADIDRRDRRLSLIRSKAKKSMGKKGKLTEGFCRGLYRKSTNINREIAQRLANEIVEFALAHGASVIVFEHLKGFRPRGGRKGSTLRQRFHGWLHRRVVQLVENKMEELGKRVYFVDPRGTSKYAYDGSGEVKRDKKNYSIARFPNGKEYHSDLSSSYNIGARYFHTLMFRERHKSRRDRKSLLGPRMPVTLSSLWEVSHNDARREAPSISEESC